MKNFVLTRLMLIKKLRTENKDLAFSMNDFNNLGAFTRGKKLKVDPARIRTWNPLIRSQMPYPLGHGAAHYAWLY